MKELKEFDQLGRNHEVINRTKLLASLDATGEFEDEGNGIDIMDGADAEDDNTDFTVGAETASAASPASQQQELTTPEAEAVVPSPSPSAESAATRQANADINQTLYATALDVEKRERVRLEEENKQYRAWHAQQEAAKNAPQQDPNAPRYIDHEARAALSQVQQELLQSKKENHKNQLQGVYQDTLSKFHGNTNDYPDFDKYVPPAMRNAMVAGMKATLDRGEPLKVDFHVLMDNQYKIAAYNDLKAKHVAPAAAAPTQAQVSQSQQKELNKLQGMPRAAAPFQQPKEQKTDVTKQKNRVGGHDWRHRLETRVGEILGVGH